MRFGTGSNWALQKIFKAVSFGEEVKVVKRTNVFSRDLVTTCGFWIDDQVYWTLTTRSYK
jgi:hypothetical protein